MIGFNYTRALPAKSLDTTVRDAIIGSIVSGAMGLGFFVFQMWAKRKAEQRFEKATAESGGVGKQQAEFYKNVLRPISKHILARIKIVGLLRSVSDKTMHDTISAISGLVHELERIGVEIDLQKLSVAQQRRLLDTIARQTRSILVPGRNDCFCSPARLFCPEITSDQFEDNIILIAASVKSALDREAQKRTLSDSHTVNRDQPSAEVELVELKHIEQNKDSVEIPVKNSLPQYSPRLLDSPSRTLSSSSNVSSASFSKVNNG